MGEWKSVVRLINLGSLFYHLPRRLLLSAIHPLPTVNPLREEVGVLVVEWKSLVRSMLFLHLNNNSRLGRRCSRPLSHRTVRVGRTLLQDQIRWEDRRSLRTIRRGTDCSALRTTLKAEEEEEEGECCRVPKLLPLM